MAWGATPGNGHETPPPANGEYSEHQSEWRARHPMRPGAMRPGFFPYPRRGMNMRPRFFHGPGPYGMLPQNFMNMRKMGPQWGPLRGPLRPPPPPLPFPPAPPENFMPFPAQPNWSAPHQPPPQTSSENQSEADTANESTTRKKRKKPLNVTARPWDKDAAERAHALELECQRSANAKSIVIRFPDPELSKEIVQGFHSSIDNVHFQGPCGGRYCFITLHDDARIDKVMEEINRIKFGVGFLHAEKKVQKPEENASYENIDPFTLYVGNLALNITVLEVKEKFPTAARIDVGHAKRMKNTRYAFVKFPTAEAALEAYKASVNTIMASRSIIVRFRRHKAPVGPPGEKPVNSDTDPQPGEKLTVGAKVKAKKEKAKAEKAAQEQEAVKMLDDVVIKVEPESDGEIEMDNDDESLSDYELDRHLEYDDDDDDDDDDDADAASISRDSDTDGDYETSGDEDINRANDDDDDDVDDYTSNMNGGGEYDDYYENDNDEYKDVFSLAFNNQKK